MHIYHQKIVIQAHTGRHWDESSGHLLGLLGPAHLTLEWGVGLSPATLLAVGAGEAVAR